MVSSGVCGRRASSLAATARLVLGVLKTSWPSTWRNSSSRSQWSRSGLPCESSRLFRVASALSMAASFSLHCTRLTFRFSRATRSSSVSLFQGGLSTLTLKIMPPWKGGRGSCLVKVLARVSVEPWDSESRFSSGMVWRDAPEHQLTWSMLTASGGWSAIWSMRGWMCPT